MKFNQVKTTMHVSEGIIEGIKISNKDRDAQLLISGSVGKDIGTLLELCKDRETELNHLLQLVFDYGTLCGKKGIGIPKLITKDTDAVERKIREELSEKNIITG